MATGVSIVSEDTKNKYKRPVFLVLDFEVFMPKYAEGEVSP